MHFIIYSFLLVLNNKILTFILQGPCVITNPSSFMLYNPQFQPYDK